MLQKSVTENEKLDHLQWLIASRADNQRCTLELYKIMRENRSIIESDVDYNLFHVTQALASACFSLWRAAFLSDVTQASTPTLDNTEDFLRHLIESNMIGFAQDVKSNHFTYRYYTMNAVQRLESIYKHNKEMHIVRTDPNPPAIDSATKNWTIIQKALTTAVTNLDQYLRARQFEPSVNS